MHELVWRLKAMLGRRRRVAEKAEELQTHIDMEIEAGLRRGLSPEEARRQARLRAGLVSEGLESAREELGFRWLDGAAADLRHAFRALIRNGGFGTVAVLVLAASVAINTLVFCLLDGVVLRPLPYPSPERLVRIYDAGKDDPKFPVSIGRFLEYRSSARSIESIALYTGNDMELTASEGASRHLAGISITSDYFTVLDRAPAIGRAFTEADLRGDVRNVIISHRLWHDRFQSDPAIAGKSVLLNRQPWTIIGVAPAGFQHVGGDYRSPWQGDTVDVWTPLALDVPDRVLRAYHFCNAVARIREGYTEEQARQELRRVAAAYAVHYPGFGDWTPRMEPLLNEVIGRSRQVVWLLVAAGALVLLIACANIAGLCVARAVARQKEFALRRALGASRWQLLRVGLAENLLIGAAGAVVGLLAARSGLPLLAQLLPADFPRAHEVGLTWAGALFAVSLSLITALLAGLAATGDREAVQSQRFTSGREARRLRRTLVAGEVALAGLLCAGALFLLRSYREIGARDHGFNREGALTFRLQLIAPGGGEAKPGLYARLCHDIRAKISDVPGVASVGATTNLPWSGYDENTTFGIAGGMQEGISGPSARYQAASAGYFEAAGMRLINGRFFGTHDGRGQPFTLIVNDALAWQFLPPGRAVGAVADLWGEKRRIVGVVAGIKDNPADLDTKPAFWLPLEQVEFPSIYFVVRSTRVDPASLTAAVTSTIHSVDPELPLAEVRTLDARAADALAARRFALLLFQSFAGLALILAAAGVYGLLAYIVQQRRRELGIRMALGAGRADLWMMVLRDGLSMASAGVLCCVILTPIGGSLLHSFLYNVRAFDLFTVAVAPALLLVVAFLASVGPAVAATQNDPALTLREE